jgi:hypothetical protein
MENTPFESIESAQQYVALLAEQVDEVKASVAADIRNAPGSWSPRRMDAMKLADYKLMQLARHLSATRRLLKDLRSVQRLLEGALGTDQEWTQAASVGNGRGSADEGVQPTI